MPPATTGVLLRMPNWLGDAIMALPALDRLAGGLGDGVRLTVACRPGMADLFRAHPGVDAWVDAAVRPAGLARRLPPDAIQAADGDKEDRARGALAGAGGRFDLGVLFTNSFSSAWRLWRLGVRRRAGYGRDGRRCLLNVAIPCPPTARACHVVRYYHNLADEILRRLKPAAAESEAAEAARVPQAPRDPATGLPIPRLVLPEDLLTAAAGLREDWRIGGGYAVLAPLSAFGAVKDWPAERYGEVAARLAARGTTVLVTGSADQEEDCEAVRLLGMGASYHHGTDAPEGAGRGRILNVAGRTTPGSFLGLLAGADLFVGGDSGGAHAAAALGTRTVAIFTVTEPTHSRPLGMRALVVGGDGGSGDGAEPRLTSAETARRREAALAAVPVDRVWRAIEQFTIHN